MKKGAILLGAGLTCLVATAFAGPEKIEYPKDWEKTFTLATTRDMHRGGNTIVDIFVNPIGVQSGKGEGPLASGTVIVMKGHRAQLDANNQLVYDAKGRLIKADASGAITVMEKRTGWGAEYGALRNGEWEYATFNAEGVRGTGSTQSCFECHGQLSEFDYVFTRFEISEIKR